MHTPLQRWLNILRDETTSKSGDDLHHSLNVFRDLVKAKPLVGALAIVALWGEFATLERLLAYADAPLRQHRCVPAWQAYSIHCLDFSLPEQPTSFDVKTTTQRTPFPRNQQRRSTRSGAFTLHLLGLWMIRPVRQEEGWSVLDLVRHIESNLVGDASALFATCLEILELDELACSNDWFIERHNRPLRLLKAGCSRCWAIHAASRWCAIAFLAREFDRTRHLGGRLGYPFHQLALRLRRGVSRWRVKRHTFLKRNLTKPPK